MLAVSIGTEDSKRAAAESNRGQLLHDHPMERQPALGERQPATVKSLPATMEHRLAVQLRIGILVLLAAVLEPLPAI